MIEYVRERFFLPGQVENWIIVMDMEQMSLMNIPFKVNLKINIIDSQICFRNSSEPLQMHIC